MRLGVDGRKIPEAARRGPLASFDHARSMGMAGLFFRSVLDMSPALDPGELAAIRAHADRLGMYLETGLGKVNPYATPEAPELRRVGDGDILLGFRRMMEACARIGCTELWAATANYKPAYVGKFAYDRFRTDVTWPEQLAATERFLRRLAPMARDLGVHINLETHEEITSFELVRLVEAVGPDVVGVVFDTANVLQRTEHPVWAARRLAPYVRQSHVKDAVLARGPGGVFFQKRPCGEGVVDFAAILTLLAAHNPALNLSIENDESHDDRPRPELVMRIDLDDPEWRVAHPDLSDAELEAYLALVSACQERMDGGGLPGLAEYGARRHGYAETVDYIVRSAAHLQAVCRDAGVGLGPPP